MLRQFSLGTLGLVLGGILALGGFVAYFADAATLNLVGFFYGIPLFLIGLALKSAELKPTPLSQPTPPEVESLREAQATEIQTQIRKDVTRYRYGQDAHFEIALDRLGLNPNEEERPTLTGLREESIDGAYALILEFDSPKISLDTWQEKQEKMETFFEAGLRVEVSQPQSDRVDLKLISTAPSDN